MFGEPACRPCGVQVRRLAQLLPEAERKRRVALVLSTRGAALDTNSLARRYAVGAGFSGVVLGDPGEHLLRTCFSEPFAWPCAVLVDGTGVVRQVLSAPEVASGPLAQTVWAYARDLPFGAERQRSGGLLYGRRLPAVGVLMDGKQDALRALTGKQPAIVSVIDPGCGSCVSLMERLESFWHAHQDVERVMLVESPSAARGVREAMRDVARLKVAVV